LAQPYDRRAGWASEAGAVDVSRRDIPYAWPQTEVRRRTSVYSRSCRHRNRTKQEAARVRGSLIILQRSDNSIIKYPKSMRIYCIAINIVIHSNRHAMAA